MLQTEAQKRSFLESNEKAVPNRELIDMHVHVNYDVLNRRVLMRTTVELTEDQRAELLKIAAQRGMKGFSQLVQEAINSYLESQASRASLISAAIEMKGSLKNKSADEFETRTKSIRENWR